MLRIVDVRVEYKRNPIGIDIMQPRIGWKLQSSVRDTEQGWYEIEVASDSDFQHPLWRTGRVMTDESTHVTYAGRPLESTMRYYCRVRVGSTRGEDSDWSDTTVWEMGLLSSRDWRAQWISADSRWPEACPSLRSGFNVRSEVSRARLYITALGLYEARINGLRVGNNQLTPGWTSYDHQIQYQTYDATSLLTSGDNAIGVTLGNGWFKGDLMWTPPGKKFHKQRCVLAQLHIEYLDGTEDVITTNGAWRASKSPILSSEIYHGETYDARLEQPGWDEAGFDDTSWDPVDVISHTTSTLVAQITQPTRIIEDVEPIALIHTPRGETVLDMGQNMVGWIKFSVRCSEGARVVLQHGEVLDSEGNFYTENLRQAKQMVTYVCRGEGTVEFEPHFTFQGFRYVKVIEFPEEVSLDRFVGRVVHSDLEQTGTFSCSDPLLNQLQHNIVWGQKGNFIDVPTDCPQRNERLGWTGDAQVFMPTAIFNMGLASFFTKWLRDLRYDQRPDGGVPLVIPKLINDRHSSAAWGDAATICPWTFYVNYRDERLLAEQFASMKSWVEYIRHQGDDEFLWNTGFHFGDWLALDRREGTHVGATPTDLIATAFYAYSAGLVARAAKVLGRHEDYETYTIVYKNIVRAFQSEFITPSGRLAANTQTGHVLALAFGLVPEEHCARVAQHLVRLIEARGYHLDTGFVGTPYLCHVLTTHDYHDVACKIVHQTDYPSWLYAVKMGATTVWEHWDGIRPDGSFAGSGMNSFNHYAYGSIGAWMYQTVAGIQIDEDTPGFKHVIIHPHFDSELEYVSAEYQSLYGRILVKWSREFGTSNTQVRVSIPPNTTGTIILLGGSTQNIYEEGQLLEQRQGIRAISQSGDRALIEVGSGDYHFVYNAAL